MHRELSASAPRRNTRSRSSRGCTWTHRPRPRRSGSSTGEPRGGRRVEGDGAAVRHDRRHAARSARSTGSVEVPLDDEGRVEWVPHLTFPGLDRGRGARPRTHEGRRAGGAPGPRRHTARRGPGRGPQHPRSGRRRWRSPARSARLRASRRASSTPSGYPAEHARRHQRARAGVQRRARRPAERPAPRGADESGTGRRGGSSRAATPVPGKPVKTTIDPDIQTAAVSALGGTYGGVAVLDARNGDVLGVAGLAFSAPQPPGSTFKVVTATAALEAGQGQAVATVPGGGLEQPDRTRDLERPRLGLRRDVRPELRPVLQHRVRAARACEVGADAMFEKAELFGFNSPPTLAAPGALEALAPPAEHLPEAGGRRRGGRERHRPGTGDSRRRCRWRRSRRRSPTSGMREPTSIVRTPRAAARGRAGRGGLAGDRRDDEGADDRGRPLGNRDRRPGAGSQRSRARPGRPSSGPPRSSPRARHSSPGEDPPQKENAWFTAFAPADKPELASPSLVVEAGPGAEVPWPRRSPSRCWPPQLAVALAPPCAARPGSRPSPPITTSAPPTTATRPPTVSFSSASRRARDRERARPLRTGSTSRRRGDGAPTRSLLRRARRRLRRRSARRPRTAPS